MAPTDVQVLMDHTQHPFWGTESALIQTDSAATTVRREFRRLQRGVYVDPTVAVDTKDLIRAAALLAGPGSRGRWRQRGDPAR